MATNTANNVIYTSAGTRKTTSGLLKRKGKIKCCDATTGALLYLQAFTFVCNAVIARDRFVLSARVMLNNS